MGSGPSLAEARAGVARRLRLAGVDSPDAEALQLLEAATGLQRFELLLSRRPLTAAEAARLEAMTARRERREPLQHVVGRAHFYGLELLAEPGALVPRPETERLVELALAALAELRAPRVLDVGTGGGAIALALKRQRPDAIVLASDVSPRALELARRNARRLGLEVDLEASDLLEAERVAHFARRAQALLANPPYLPSADRAAAPPELSFDPPEALYAGVDGLDVYRRLERQAFALLPSGSLMLVELDPRNVQRARDEARGWAGAGVHLDLAGRPRFLELRR